MSTIFFCPVGKTDPMSVYRNTETGEIEAYDASMMHIYRHYRPDYTYLYMTDEIYAIEQAEPHRYSRAMELLSKSLGKSFVEGQDYSILRSSVTDEVYDMDAFYDDFYQKILDICHENEEDPDIVINISSGTPAMKSALFVLKSMKNLKVRLIQALDPFPQRRPEHQNEYNVDSLFALNKDNDLSDGEIPDDTKFRLKDVSNRNLNSMKINEIMKNLIDTHDYEAALQIFTSFFVDEEDAVDDESRKLEDFICFSSYRKMQTLDKLKNKRGRDYEVFKKEYVPFFEQTSKRYVSTEYLLKLRLSFDRGEYTEALRAMTPVDTELLSLVFNNISELEIHDYVNKHTGFFADSKFFTQRFKDIYKESSLSKDSKPKMLGPSTLKSLIKSVIKKKKDRGHVIQDENELFRAMNGITKVESKIRNLVAHTMTAITEKEFLERAELRSVNELFGYYETLLKLAGYDLQQFDWHSYARMNDDIKKMIDEVL